MKSLILRVFHYYLRKARLECDLPRFQSCFKVHVDNEANKKGKPHEEAD